MFFFSFMISKTGFWVLGGFFGFFLVPAELRVFHDRFWSEKNYSRTKENVPQENKAGAGSFVFLVPFSVKTKA